MKLRQNPFGGLSGGLTENSNGQALLTQRGEVDVQLRVVRLGLNSELVGAVLAETTLNITTNDTAPAGRHVAEVPGRSGTRRSPARRAGPGDADILVVMGTGYDVTPALAQPRSGPRVPRPAPLRTGFRRSGIITRPSSDSPGSAPSLVRRQPFYSAALLRMALLASPRTSEFGGSQALGGASCLGCGGMEERQLAAVRRRWVRESAGGRQ